MAEPPAISIRDLRIGVFVALIVLFFVGDWLIRRQLMKHYRGPERTLWSETPVVDPTVFSEDGRRWRRILYLYWAAGILVIALIVAGLNRLQAE